MGDAVRRNRVKRLVREFFRVEQESVRRMAAQCGDVAHTVHGGAANGTGAAVSDARPELRSAACALEIVVVAKRGADPDSMTLHSVREELLPLLRKALRAPHRTPSSRRTT